MKSLSKFSLAIAFGGLLATASYAGPGLQFWQQQRQKAQTPPTAGDSAYYTCPMHPSVRSQDPHGKCPICGMDLVPVKKADAQAKSTPDRGKDDAGRLSPEASRACPTKG